MEASIVQLRYQMHDVLRALSRNERVKVLYHGKLKGILMPYQPGPRGKMADHPFVGMSRRKRSSVLEELNRLRAPRHHAL
jgi:hypothetical protein